MNRLFFQDNANRTRYTGYFYTKLETKDYTVMIDGQNVLDELAKNYLKAYYNMIKISTGQLDHYTTGCLLDYFYFREHYKLIAIDLSKQPALDADPKAIQQLNFSENLDRVGNTTMFFIIEEAKGTTLDFSQGTVRVLYI